MNELHFRLWLDSVSAQSGSEVTAEVIANSLSGDTATRCIVTSIIEMYYSQNRAIDEYARSKGLNDLPLADLEKKWTEDPDGEERFFEDYRNSHQDEWAMLSNGLNMSSFAIFQICWLFSPEHKYLVSMSRPEHPQQVATADLYADADALARLRARFRPFNQAILT